jgi:S-adenosyl-L-methionine hydrolase (adenosine-forming)
MVAPSGIVTLLTDFGTEDAYVGILKGVILQINPVLTIVDLTHQIPPQNVALGAFQLHQTYRHFPPGTVHLAVVDPGVGGTRSAIAIMTPTGCFVGPNNGILGQILTDAQHEGSFADCHALILDNPRYWYTSAPSRTFHGRDVFAAAAAHLASGLPFQELGTPMVLEQLALLDLLQFQSAESGLRGFVQAVDRFGNVISNIPNDAVQDRTWLAKAAEQNFPSHSTYSEVSVGSPLSLVGSHGWVELSVSGGNAQQQYGLGIGDPIELTWS